MPLDLSGDVMSARLDELFADYPKRLGPPEVAELLGMSIQGVYKLIRAQVIPAYKLGGSWIILRDELRDTIAAGSNLTGTDPTPAETEPAEGEPAGPESDGT